MVFSGAPRVRSEARESDAKFQREICAASTAWWDAYLRGDQAAKEWLMQGQFAKMLGKDGTFEVRRAEASR